MRIGGRLYVVGGRAGGTLFDVVEVFDPVTGSWSGGSRACRPRAAASAPASSTACCMPSGGKATRRVRSAPSRNAEAYDPVRDVWTRLPDMGLPRHGIGVAAVGGALYVIGGATRQGLGPSGASEVFIPGRGEGLSIARLSGAGGRRLALRGRLVGGERSRSLQHPGEHRGRRPRGGVAACRALSLASGRALAAAPRRRTSRATTLRSAPPAERRRDRPPGARGRGPSGFRRARPADDGVRGARVLRQRARAPAALTRATLRRVTRTMTRGSESAYVRMPCTTLPNTSVRRKSRPLIAEGEPLVVDAEEVEHRRVQVVDVDGVLDGVVAEVVGGAVGRAAA